MRKTSIRFLLGLSAAMLCAAQAFAFAVGTFNIEYFDVSGKKRYSESDCALLARKIAGSGADVLALQEIEGDATMRYFTMRHLTGWQFLGNDSKGKQDPYFLWNPAKVKLVDDPAVYFANASFVFDGHSNRLFDRPLLTATFVDIENNRRYTLVNVHLKSQSTRGKDDRQGAIAYNDAKREAQIKKLNELVETLRPPVFVMGDFNSSNPAGTSFPLMGLTPPHYSFDNMKSNLDYIGCIGLQPSPKWKLYEVESSIPSRSTRRSEHPDHDIIVLDLGDGK